MKALLIILPKRSLIESILNRNESTNLKEEIHNTVIFKRTCECVNIADVWEYLLVWIFCGFLSLVLRLCLY